MVRTIRCSLSKIILGVALLTSSFLFIQFVLNILGEGHKQIVEKNLAANERNLKSAFSSNEVNSIINHNLQDIKKKLKEEEENDNFEFIEVLRDKPKVSFSLSSTLEKLLEDERKIHNTDVKKITNEHVQLSWPNSGQVSVGGAELVPQGPSNLSSLKASLKDPSFVQKIRNLEDKRQVRTGKHLNNIILTPL